MKGGDLSNEVAPSSIIIWEGLLALPTLGSDRARKLAHRLHRYKTVISHYEANEWALKQVHDAAYRYGVRFDVVSYLPVEYEDIITEWCDRYSLAYKSVFCSTPGEVSKMTTAPFLESVIDADLKRYLFYGGKGRCVDPETFSWMG